MKVLFVVPYPVGKAASQRFRVEQFLPYLEERSIKYELAPFWGVHTHCVLYRKGHTLQKIAGTLAGFLKRLVLLLQLHKYDFVFVHREATPVGPPWFEWLAAKVFRKKLIFDFDDAIWLRNTSAENMGVAKLKYHSKTASICAWSHKASVGNNFLQQYASKYNRQVVYLPSTLDMAKYSQTKQHAVKEVVIGWTGSHSTLPYLKLLEPVLQKLERQYTFNLVVIADKAPDLNLESLKFVPWKPETEIEDLLQFDIGVMPLPDTDWAKGKCAFKALQYMALGIPALVSAVGTNLEAVPNGKGGYTCTTEQEWYNCLEQLILDADLRAQLGATGKAWVAGKYSLQQHLATFLSLFE